MPQQRGPHDVPDGWTGHPTAVGASAAPVVAPDAAIAARPPVWTRATASTRIAVLSVWAVLAAAIWYVLAFNPTDRVPDPSGPCLWHVMFGVNGPACGGTRMVWYLLHGDVVQAARHHLVALIGVPFAGYALLAWTVSTFTSRRPPRVRLPLWIYLSYAAAWLLYSTVLRNLPWPPWRWFDIPNLT